jgi:deoxycytidylate deaminase
VEAEATSGVVDQVSDLVFPETNSELFIGLVSATGTDLTNFSKLLEQCLATFKYQTQANHLIEALHEIKKWRDLPETPVDERIDRHMTAGTEFRETICNGAAVALLGVGGVVNKRRSLSGKEDTPFPRCAYIFRGLKHPNEVEVLRSIYGRGFVLIGIYAPHQFRLDSLARRIAESNNEFHDEPFRSTAEHLINRDQQETGSKFGQNVRDTFHRADVFVDASAPEKLRQDIERFIELLFGSSMHTPTRDEYGMFHAQTAALRSADLGRQVGAAIATQEGDIVAIGTNEVPKAGGGLYWTGDKPDSRDFVLGFDANDKSKRNLLGDILERLKKARWLSEEKCSLTTDQLIEESIGEKSSFLRKAQFMNLIEFGRAVHAEMAALIDAARRGVSVKGATLYCTAFPCHLCARHIVAAGIARVVYVEPYPKSRATQLYPDSISVESPVTNANTICFEPFVGVAPLQYLNLFSMQERKDKDGFALSVDQRAATPRCQSSSPTYLRNEKSSLDWLNKAMRAKNLLGD